MKKLGVLITAALILAFYLPQNISAQTSKSTDPPRKTTYTQIKTTELPAAVTNAVTKENPNCTIEKAYSSDNGNYKVEIKKGMEHRTLIYDKDGNMVKTAEHMKSMSDTKKQ